MTRHQTSALLPHSLTDHWEVAWARSPMLGKRPWLKGKQRAFPTVFCEYRGSSNPSHAPSARCLQRVRVVWMQSAPKGKRNFRVLKNRGISRRPARHSRAAKRRLGENSRALRETQYRRILRNRASETANPPIPAPHLTFRDLVLRPLAARSSSIQSHRGCAVLCSSGGFRARVLVPLATCSNSARADRFPCASIPANCGDSFAADTFARRSSPFDIPRTEMRNSRSRRVTVS
jgi:hypothetical protein